MWHHNPVQQWQIIENEHGLRIIGSRAQDLGILLLLGPIDVVCDQKHPVHVASKGASGGSGTCQSQHCELVLSFHRLYCPGETFMRVGRGSCLQACFGQWPLGTKRGYRQLQPIPSKAAVSRVVLSRTKGHLNPRTSLSARKSIGRLLCPLNTTTDLSRATNQADAAGTQSPPTL